MNKCSIFSKIARKHWILLLIIIAHLNLTFNLTFNSSNEIVEAILSQSKSAKTLCIKDSECHQLPDGWYVYRTRRGDSSPFYYYGLINADYFPKRNARHYIAENDRHALVSYRTNTAVLISDTNAYLDRSNSEMLSLRRREAIEFCGGDAEYRPTSILLFNDYAIKYIISKESEIAESELRGLICDILLPSL